MGVKRFRVAVLCPRTTPGGQTSRASVRGRSAERIALVDSWQFSQADKAKASDFVVDNGGDEDALRAHGAEASAPCGRARGGAERRSSGGMGTSVGLPRIQGHAAILLEEAMITVYGGGSWGTALAHVLASAGREVSLLLRDEAVAAAVNERHENPRYLPGLPLAPSLRAVTDSSVLGASDVWVLAVPCQNQRGALEAARTLLRPETVIVNAAKGIELDTLKPLSVVTREALGGTEEDVRCRYAMLSGPSFAREVVENKPSAVVLGCAEETLGARLRAMFATPWFRCYSSPDVRGVELGGAVKNVIAIAAGVCDGLRFGDNARAALVTRGLAEITRLGVAMGARASTFMGLSGLGDLDAYLHRRSFPQPAGGTASRRGGKAR